MMRVCAARWQVHVEALESGCRHWCPGTTWLGTMHAVGLLPPLPGAGNYRLAMGALTGAGMFVGAVVAGRIITLNGGVRARGAQLRDISSQFITVLVVIIIGECLAAALWQTLCMRLPACACAGSTTADSLHSAWQLAVGRRGGC